MSIKMKQLPLWVAALAIPGTALANADVAKHNPVGKIPVLSVKGMDLFDSPVICEYLDGLHKKRRLLPRKG